MHGCKSTSLGSCGGALAMDSANALVTHCVFSNNVSYTDANTYGQSKGRGPRSSLLVLFIPDPTARRPADF